MTAARQRLLAALASPLAVPLLFVLFVGIRAALLAMPLDAVSDAGWYDNRGVAIADGRGYSEGGMRTAFWPPGWPLLLGALFKLFGASQAIVQLFNLLCAALGAWLTLDLGRRLFASELAGRAALLVVAVYPNHAAYVPLVLTEVLYTTLTLAGCWLLIARPGGVGLLAAGAVFGLSTLVKAQSLLLVPLICAIAALRARGRLAAWWTSARRAAVVLAVAIAVVVPWTLRNHAVFGEWIFVSTNGGFTLLTGNNPSADGGYSPDDPLVIGVPRSVAGQVAADREYKHRAVEWIQTNPGDFLRLVPLKLWRLWAPDGEAESSYQAGYRGYEDHWPRFRAVRVVNQACYALLLAAFRWAGWLLFSGRRSADGLRFGWWLLPYAVALYPTIIAIVLSGQSRFHYRVMPFVAMVCGWLLVQPSRMASAATSRKVTA